MATTTPRLSRRARREQLLDAATSLVRGQGTDGLTLVTLAEAAGVSRPIVYDHFGTRPGLLRALHDRLEERHRAAITQALEDAPATAPDVARVIGTAYFACATDMPELAAVTAALKGGAESEATDDDLTDGYTDLMTATLSPYTDLPREALRLRCTALLGAADAIADELNRGRTTSEEAVAALTELILGGLGARG
ncbi:TetR/AcrR family transcriptional regulator [Streptomyces cinnabarinus]|uniref:TetR/AcrR family transcriptional regulator n=1 Tax=Streptomyces cinnabarinus TaxID=67287 RepID=A0ABY7K962_9ACTN|nr:TetR/AcrR family transcriptional regulator [Streptomyces cinnabarinus]WAZ19271.1 TetR/AcrR family transcriptional regulator [Streptomyces cinnabarinus]